MKRSEALLKIQELLQRQGFSGVPLSSYEIEANEILDLVENELGMLPPKSRIATNPDNPKFPELKYIKEFVNEWEPEDEKK